jgi:PAS domain S-box-containing protein
VDRSQLTDNLQAYRQFTLSICQDLEQLPPEDLAALGESHPEVHRLLDQVRILYPDGIHPQESLPSQKASLAPNLTKTLLESITDALMLIDREWRIVYTNERAAQNGFFNPADLIGRDLWEVFPQLLDTPLETHYRQVMETRQASHFELKGVLRDQWYLISVYPSEVGITVYWMDFTAQKAVESQVAGLLSENQRNSVLLEAIYQADPDGLAVVVDPDLRFVYTNLTYRYLTPDPRLDPVGHSYQDVWAADRGMAYPEAVAETLATGKPFLQTGIVRAFPDGTQRFFTLQVRRLAWDKQPGALLILWDVTDQMRVEEALRQSEERFRTSVEYLLDGFAIFSPVREPGTGRVIDFRYEYINQAGCRMNRRTREDTVGHTLLELLPAHRETGLIDEYIQLVETGRPLVRDNLVYEDIFGDRRLRLVFDHRAFRLGDGFALTWRDVTDRVQAEETLRQSEARLNRSQEIAHLGSWELDLSENRLTWSDEVYRIFGLAPQAFGATYEAFLEHVHPEDRAAVNAAYAGSIQEGRDSYEIEHRVVRADTGEVRFVHEKCEHVRNDTGDIIRSIGMVHDITDRKRGEQTLQEAYRQIKSLARFPEENPNPVARISTDGQMLYCNSASQRLFGWTCVVGKSVQRNLVPLLQLAMAHGRYVEQDVPMGERTYSLAIMPVLEEGYINLYGRDITERKQAEEALRDSETRFRNLAEATFEGILISEQGVVTDVNEQFAAMFGYRVPEVRGKRLTEFVAAEERSLLQQAVERGQERIHVYRALKKDGTEFFVEAHGRGMTLNDRLVRITSVRDITERKLSEAQIHLQIEALKAAANGVLITDREGTIQWANPAFSALTGYSQEEAIGKNPRDLVRSGAHDRAFYEDLWTTILSGRVWWGDMINRRKDGTLYTEEMTITPVSDPEGGITHFVAIKQDVSARKRIEEEARTQADQIVVHRRLLEQRELERLQIARDLHDGPLQNLSLLSFDLSAAAQMAKDKRLEAAIQTAIDTVRDQIRELREFTTELRPPLLVKFGLAKAIAAHAESFQEKKTGLRLYLDLSPETPPLTEPVGLALYRIYQEALNNILKHAQASEVWVRYTWEDRTAVLEIRDNGVGFTVPEAWLDLMRQGHLGLVGMRERVDAVGGEVNISSWPNQGTTIQVSVPVSNPGD